MEKQKENPLESFEVTTHSAISVVNAIPAGKGATIGIDIPCTVRVILTQQNKSGLNKIKIASKTRDPHDLVRTAVEYALAEGCFRIPRSMELRIQIKSKIPDAVGLKSSSAVSVAAAKAVFGLFAKKIDFRAILKISCNASKDSKASLTGAYDDAAASLLGGVVFADNSRFEIIKHTSVPENLGTKVAILLPVHKSRLTSSIDRSVYSRYRKENLLAFQYALEGKIGQAMVLNSIIQSAALGYSTEPVSSALLEGARAAGITGKGPAIAALCSDSETLENVSRQWKRKNPDSRVIKTLVVQPKRLALGLGAR
ncbi:MAG: shikimate kinase [Nitrososphaerales archaeon]